MATTWEMITVRVERPPETPLGDFFAEMRSWLDHHCIMLADFRAVTLANKSGVFDVLLDNPRDARLFGRRFAAQPTSNVLTNVSGRKASRPAVGVAMPDTDQSRASTLAVLAGEVRSVLWTRAKLRQSA
jgi:hypothetical protein